MPRSAGHLIVDTLAAHGVERVYAVPGESYLDVLDGLYDSPIRTVVCRQEGGAGFMALAEGRLTGRPGIVMVTRGPGAANAMIAIHTAWQDATPLVMFVGLIPVRDRGLDSFQEFSLEGWFGTTAKRVVVLDDPDRAGEVVAEAMHLASSGRPGPVVIGLPEDVLVRTTERVASHPRPSCAPIPSEHELAELRARIDRAERPLIIAGGDGWHGRTGADLARAAERAGIPVACDWRAYDAVPHTSDAYAGWLGYGRADTTVRHYEESDLHIFIGCGRSDVLSEGFTAGLDTETVVVSLDPALVMHAGRTDQHILASPAEFVPRFAALEFDEREPSWMQQVSDDQRRYAAPRADAPATGVDLGVAFAVLDELLESDRVLTYGAGNATIWGHRYLQHEVPNSLVGPRNGAMGLAVPAAVAAGLVFPDRRIVAVCGDGDFLMNGQELAVAIAEGLRPLVIVVDNGRYGTIVQHQEREYPNRPSGTDLVNPDFGAWMRSFGGHGERIERTDEVRDAVVRALASERPALIHLVVDPATMPPSTKNDDTDGK